MNQHLINRLIFDFSISDEAENVRLQKQIRENVYRHLLPALEAMFSQIFASNDALLIETLTLDLGQLNWSDLDDDLTTRVCESLQLKLEEKILTSELDSIVNNPVSLDSCLPNDQNVYVAKSKTEADQEAAKRLTSDKKSIEQLVHYLQFGTLIWWSNQQDMRTNLISVLQEQPNNLRDAVTSLLAHIESVAAKVSRRLVALVSYDHESMASLFLLFSTNEQQQDHALLSGVLENIETYSSNKKMEVFGEFLIKLVRLPLPSQKLIAMVSTLVDPSFITQGYSSNIQFDKNTLRKERNNNVNAANNKDALNNEVDSSLTTAETANQILVIDTQQEAKTRATQVAQYYSQHSQIKVTSEATHRTNLDRSISNQALSGQENTLPWYSKHINQEQDSLYINNAGLVLLWPFLLNLFELLCLKQDDQLKDKQQALLVLHLLTTEQRPNSEQDLLLAKLLCNQPFDQATALDMDVTEEHKEIIYGLLQSAIHHWSALGRVSVAWFQQVFLKRNGVLKRQQHGWLLQVEAGPPDVLLNKLPWGISTIKLLWMPQPLTVQWAY